MIVSKKQMQVIVEELERTIGRNINIMDENGCIIASTNIKRIGQYHGGALRIVKEQLSQLAITESETYSGAEKGINLPIIIEDKIVGVVGISGEKEEVEGFGKIIKKMTEILILDSHKNTQKKLESTAKNNFVFNWLFGAEDESDSIESFRSSGLLLGIDIDLSRIVMIMNLGTKDSESLENPNKLEQQRLQESIMRDIKKYIQSKKPGRQDIVLQLGWKIVTFFDSEDIIKTRSIINEMVPMIEKQHNVYVYCGVGNVGRNRMEIRKSFREADMALNIVSKYKKSGIKSYGDIDMEILIENLSDQDKQKFVKKVFGNCTKEEIEVWVQLLRSYIDHNASINRTAESLFIHKNTLQYRLGKIKRQTGHDPRNISELLPLYIAAMIWELDKSRGI